MSRSWVVEFHDDFVVEFDAFPEAVQDAILVKALIGEGGATTWPSACGYAQQFRI